MATKRRALKKVHKTKRNPYLVTKLEIDIDQLLLHGRQLFLSSEIDESVTAYTIKGMIGLAEISDEPILLWINSPGGNALDGFAIIDTMNSLKAPVLTIINGKACSMAGLIALAGKQRAMTANSIFMAHEMTAGNYDYAQKMFDRTEFYQELNKRIINYLSTHSKLTQADIEKAQRGELWLNAEQCLEKGVIDHILRGKK